MIKRRSWAGSIMRLGIGPHLPDVETLVRIIPVRCRLRSSDDTVWDFDQRIGFWTYTSLCVGLRRRRRRRTDRLGGQHGAGYAGRKVRPSGSILSVELCFGRRCLAVPVRWFGEKDAQLPEFRKVCPRHRRQSPGFLRCLGHSTWETWIYCFDQRQVRPQANLRCSAHHVGNASQLT